MARQLSENHLKEYQKGGVFYKLFNFIQKDPELSFEIRKDNKVIVYYNKKTILTISKGKKVEPLSSKYLKNGDQLSVDISNKESWGNESLIEKYFKESKRYAYIQSKKSEFVIQQNIALGSRSFDTGLVVVDMEWEFSQAGIPSNEKIDRTIIDLVAVNPIRNKEGYNDIYLVEVKHSLVATKNDSGIKNHIDKSSQIIRNKKACNDLKDDVMSIINQKSILGILKGKKPDFNFSPTPKIFFFLSYRSDEELNQLKKQVAELEIPKDITQPLFKYYNYTIQLKLE